MSGIQVSTQAYELVDALIESAMSVRRRKIQLIQEDNLIRVAQGLPENELPEPFPKSAFRASDLHDVFRDTFSTRYLADEKKAGVLKTFKVGKYVFTTRQWLAEWAQIRHLHKRPSRAARKARETQEAVA